MAAASVELDQQVFQETGKLVPTSKTWASPQSYVNLNTVDLSAKGVHVFVNGIQLSGGDNIMSLDVSADLTIFFPSVVPQVIVTEIGVAKLRALTHFILQRLASPVSSQDAEQARKQNPSEVLITLKKS
ncbi:MAG: hypothetical protein CVU42_00225 [Chloroflexi bacterium HGW-Chloroflexi-4]|nr:MAG: hypothetical protein CVU42_00225 [Chloroflexi bacterium HGW-Chloroflexi-4]